MKRIAVIALALFATFSAISLTACGPDSTKPVQIDRAKGDVGGQ